MNVMRAGSDKKAAGSKGPKASYNWAATAMLSALVFLLVAAAQPAQGAVTSLDTIRVGLFLDVPGKYTLNTATATVSSAAPIQVGLRQPSGVTPLFQSSAGESIRFTLDDYKPKVLETGDFQTALSAAKRLKAIGGTPLLTSLFENNGTAYQVLEGTYTTAAAARTASEKWQKDGTIAALGGQAKPDITGPLHAEAGSFNTREEAAAAAKSFGAAGIDAFAAIKSVGGAAGSYTVIVGAAADSAALDNIKAQAAAADNGLPLTATDPAAAYVIIRNDHTISEAAAAPQMLYSVPMAESKLWLSTSASSGIKLTERYNRSYRGQIELSGVNNKLTVINELPFEQYLYAVVGAEMPASWPAEALKSQAVAARTYALFQGFKFQVAHVVDTTLSQAYGGIGSEKPTTIAAVDATKGEVLTYNGSVIEALFSSSAGGQTADSMEIWGNDVGYLKTVPSPDESSEKGLKHWQRAVLPTGVVGYIREDLLEETGEKNAAGQPLMRVNADSVQVRPAPLVDE
ncbi:SpoIID/LytB domain-containing protein, partial [Paenibacillus sepulcri]|nr:SpoIID/LytB domain-containing protein [Paenibacillus sepulcri]